MTARNVRPSGIVLAILSALKNPDSEAAVACIEGHQTAEAVALSLGKLGTDQKSRTIDLIVSKAIESFQQGSPAGWIHLLALIPGALEATKDLPQPLADLVAMPRGKEAWNSEDVAESVPTVGELRTAHEKYRNTHYPPVPDCTSYTSDAWQAVLLHVVGRALTAYGRESRCRVRARMGPLVVNTLRRVYQHPDAFLAFGRRYWGNSLFDVAGVSGPHGALSEIYKELAARELVISTASANLREGTQTKDEAVRQLFSPIEFRNQSVFFAETTNGDTIPGKCTPLAQITPFILEPDGPENRRARAQLEGGALPAYAYDDSGWSKQKAASLKKFSDAVSKRQQSWTPDLFKKLFTFGPTSSAAAPQSASYIPHGLYVLRQVLVGAKSVEDLVREPPLLWSVFNTIERLALSRTGQVTGGTLEFAIALYEALLDLGEPLNQRVLRMAWEEVVQKSGKVCLERDFPLPSLGDEEPLRSEEPYPRTLFFSPLVSDTVKGVDSPTIFLGGTFFLLESERFPIVSERLYSHIQYLHDCLVPYTNAYFAKALKYQEEHAKRVKDLEAEREALGERVMLEEDMLSLTESIREASALADRIRARVHPASGGFLARREDLAHLFRQKLQMSLKLKERMSWEDLEAVLSEPAKKDRTKALRALNPVLSPEEQSVGSSTTGEGNSLSFKTIHELKDVKTSDWKRYRAVLSLFGDLLDLEILRVIASLPSRNATQRQAAFKFAKDIVQRVHVIDRAGYPGPRSVCTLRQIWATCCAAHGSEPEVKILTSRRREKKISGCSEIAKCDTMVCLAPGSKPVEFLQPLYQLISSELRPAGEGGRASVKECRLNVDQPSGSLFLQLICHGVVYPSSLSRGDVARPRGLAGCLQRICDAVNQVEIAESSVDYGDLETLIASSVHSVTLVRVAAAPQNTVLLVRLPLVTRFGG